MTDGERTIVYYLIRRAAKRHGVCAIDILSHRRQSEIVRARFAAILSVKHAFPHFSLPRMGQIFLRHHTSILHAYRRGYEMGLGTC
jgi:chromosomal replication initiation ATPase DnaA